MASWVGPAVTSTRVPAKGPSCTASVAETISSTEASLPSPVSPQARRPDTGMTTEAPRLRSTERLACVAGFCHMCTFMAGARSKGAMVARAAEVRQSSAMPQAIFAMTSAVQGHTTNTSAHSPSSIWGMDERGHVKRSVATGTEVSPSNVAVPTKRVAASVMVTRTSQPAFCRPRHTSAAL